MAECDVCGSEFDTYKGMRVHQSRSGHMDKPWRDEERVREMYIKKKKSAYEIADELGCGATAVYEALRDFGIERRGDSESARLGVNKKPACYRTHHRDGYEEWFNTHDGKTYYCRVHRLAAVAWFGLESVEESVVHHKKNIPWLNTEDNLSVVESQSEHAKMHHNSRKRDGEGKYV